MRLFIKASSETLLQRARGGPLTVTPKSLVRTIPGRGPRWLPIQRTGRFTTVTVSDDGYFAEWCNTLCATTPVTSS
jgi:hypothetical protein